MSVIGIWTGRSTPDPTPGPGLVESCSHTIRSEVPSATGVGTRSWAVSEAPWRSGTSRQGAPMHMRCEVASIS